MGLNCKPGQRAWICVPNTQQNELAGITAIHGHVVTAVRLHPTLVYHGEPTWVVDPPQCVVLTRAFMSPRFGFLPQGSRMGLDSVPDSYLRPFDDFPPEELDELVKELAL